VLWRRSPPGFDKVVFDVWAEHFAAFARSNYPQEDKLSSFDGAQVHLSPAGLLTLLRANVHVIAEPSQMSHILQALDNKSAFGRYQPKLRSRVREIATEGRDAGRQFNTPELMRCIAAPSSDALTVTALTTAFRLFDMWPLDPTVVTGEELSKGADAPVTSVDLEKLTRRLIPSVRKDMMCARVVNRTLSTAGRGTVLTAPEILAALEGEAAAKAAARKAKEAGKRACEAKAEERKLLAAQVERAKSAQMRAVQAAARREMWAELAFDAAREEASRMRAMGILGPSASKLWRRAAAARARRPSAATHPLPLHILRRVVALQATRAASGR